VIVCVSRLVTRKGQDVLIEALPAVHERVPEAALLLVGDGPRRPALERSIRRLGLVRDVVMTGAVPWEGTPAFYDAGDVFAMPTRTRLAGLEVEALGICFLEAAATGLPVVVGDSGGARDAVVDGKTGVVVPGRSVRAVSERLTELLLDRDLARRFGERGRAWVAEAWTWDRRVQQLLGYLSIAAHEGGDTFTEP
jgi:phosphatidylinositol alpha-1,6-mannosyltransferase